MHLLAHQIHHYQHIMNIHGYVHSTISLIEVSFSQKSFPCTNPSNSESESLKNPSGTPGASSSESEQLSWSLSLDEVASMSSYKASSSVPSIAFVIPHFLNPRVMQSLVTRLHDSATHYTTCSLLGGLIFPALF